MGFFKKKADPISQRARTLNQQIAALEDEIKRLSAQPPPQNHEPAPPANSKAAATKPETPAPAQPRLRSTALPHGHSGSTVHAQPQQPTPIPPATREDAFRKSAPEREDELGVRNHHGPSLWQRIKNNFRAPPASNPRLVNYLAAGSIHGLRPLRYEKRVARNRFILLVVVLAVVLWGIVAALLKR